MKPLIASHILQRLLLPSSTSSSPSPSFSFSFFCFFFFFFFFFSLPVISAASRASAAGSNGYIDRRQQQLSAIAISNASFSSSSSSSDVVALLAVKASLRDPRGLLSSWKASGNTGGGNSTYNSACEGKWLGVKCDSGKVIALHLPSKGLSGTLATEIGDLPSLRQLSLHSNAIAGPIPSSISSLRNLRGLYLFRNLFSGSIPTTFSPVLQALDLSKNRLSGPIPPEIASSALLRRLDLSYNSLSSTIPSSLSSLARLQTLILSHNQILGSIPPHLAQQLTYLQILDLSHNLLNGSYTVFNDEAMQSDSVSLSSSSSLRTLNLSFNGLTGPLPSELGELTMLLNLDLSNNDFSGPIPAELGNISGLSSLDISHNNLSGSIPSSFTKLTNLTIFNCSYNSLTGEVPKLSHSFDDSAFSGNLGLCAFSSSSPCPAIAEAPSPSGISGADETSTSTASSSSSSSSHQSRKKKLSVLAMAFIIVGAVIVVLLTVCLCSVLLVCCFRRWEVSKGGGGGGGVVLKGSMEEDQKGYGEGRRRRRDDDDVLMGGKLVHFEGSVGFSANDLLCATAEVLGKSTYGTVYKATMEDGHQVAVKRLREGIVVKNQKDMEDEVRSLGSIRHSNLLSLRAFYWGPKDEKLLIFDFMQGGSLAAFIHARGPETPLTWPTRMNIAVGAARGLAHLHDREATIHGNLTSSNILIDGHLNPKISDFALFRLMTQAANSTAIAAAGALGYTAPELTKLRRATPKSDVYSFGIVLLELLTGKAPSEAITPSYGYGSSHTTSSDADAPGGAMDLPEWVASVLKHQWTHEVFDAELMKGRHGGPASDEELINTLQVAMACVKHSPMDRPDISEVVRQLEQIRPELKQSTREK